MGKERRSEEQETGAVDSLLARGAAGEWRLPQTDSMAFRKVVNDLVERSESRRQDRSLWLRAKYAETATEFANELRDMAAELSTGSAENYDKVFERIDAFRSVREGMSLSRRARVALMWIVDQQSRWLAHLGVTDCLLVATMVKVLFDDAFPRYADRLLPPSTRESPSDPLRVALRSWHRGSGRPRKFSKQPTKWEAVAALMESIGLGGAKPDALAAEWRDRRPACPFCGVELPSRTQACASCEVVDDVSLGIMEALAEERTEDADALFRVPVRRMPRRSAK